MYIVHPDRSLLANKIALASAWTIILYLEEPDTINETIVCNLNNSGGLKGFIVMQKNAQSNTFSNIF